MKYTLTNSKTTMIINADNCKISDGYFVFNNATVTEKEVKSKVIPQFMIKTEHVDMISTEEDDV